MENRKSNWEVFFSALGKGLWAIVKIAWFALVTFIKILWHVAWACWIAAMSVI